MTPVTFCSLAILARGRGCQTSCAHLPDRSYKPAGGMRHWPAGGRSANSGVLHKTSVSGIELIFPIGSMRRASKRYVLMPMSWCYHHMQRAWPWPCLKALRMV